MSSPLVSVIVPNYNHHLYLPERIDSILSQEFQDFELILLDDCSPDDSVEIFERYRSKPKVSHICVNEQNSGSTFKQWEKGISLARGKYIWIAESDDSADPRLLGSIVNALERYPSAVMGFCSTVVIDSEGRVLDINIPDDYPQKFCTLHDGCEFVRRKMIYETSIVNASAVVFKREVWAKVDKGFTFYRLCGDWLFWIEVMRQGDVVWIHRKFNRFRKHLNKVTPRAFKEGLNFWEMKGVLDYMHRRIGLDVFYINLLRGYTLINMLRSTKLDSALRKPLLKWWVDEYPQAPVFAVFMGFHLLFRDLLIVLRIRKRKYKRPQILSSN